MTEEDKKRLHDIIFWLQQPNGFLFALVDAERLSLKLQFLPFIQALLYGNPNTPHEVITTARDLFYASMMELAENEYNNGLSKDLQ